MRILICLLVIVCVLGDILVYDGTTGELVTGFDNWYDLILLFVHLLCFLRLYWYSLSLRSWATVDLQSTQVVAPGDKYVLVHLLVHILLHVHVPLLLYLLVHLLLLNS